MFKEVASYADTHPGERKFTSYDEIENVYYVELLLFTGDVYSFTLSILDLEGMTEITADLVRSEGKVTLTPRKCERWEEIRSFGSTGVPVLNNSYDLTVSPALYSWFEKASERVPADFRVHVLGFLKRYV